MPYDEEARIYGYRHVATHDADVTASYTDRDSRTMNGYAAVMGETRLDGDIFPDPYLVANASFSPFDVTVDTDVGTNTVSIQMALGDILDESLNEIVVIDDERSVQDGAERLEEAQAEEVLRIRRTATGAAT